MSGLTDVRNMPSLLCQAHGSLGYKCKSLVACDTGQCMPGVLSGEGSQRVGRMNKYFMVGDLI